MPHDIALNAGLRVFGSCLFGALCMAGILAFLAIFFRILPLNEQEAARHDPSLFVLLYAGGLLLVTATGLYCGWRTYCHERDKPR